VITTLAGSFGDSGNADGTSQSAKFNQPSGLAYDGSTYLYVADRSNHSIRKIKISTGEVSTVSISGAVSLDSPFSVAIDKASGATTLYVGDSSSNLLIKIDSQGSATAVGGSVSTPGAKAVVIGGSRNLYVADSVGNQIYKVTAAGVKAVFAGSGSSGSADGTGNQATFNGPSGLALDSFGNLFVSDRGSHLIRKISSTGLVTTLAGNSGVAGSKDASGVSAKFNDPQGLAFDSGGYLYVADSSNSLIRKIE
jgi:hypothetical protein